MSFKQNGLRQAGVTRNDNFEMPYRLEGVVVGIHYPTDATNKSKSDIEYDVDITSATNLGRLYNVPRINQSGGLDDGDDTVLRVAKTTVGAAPFAAESTPGKPRTPLAETDGDRVLVSFINGSIQRPVIDGVVRHRSSRRQFKDAEGKDLPKDGKLFRRTTHRGTEVVLDDNGSIVLTLGKTPDIKGNPTNDEKFVRINIGDLIIVIDNQSSPTTVSFRTKDGKTLLAFNHDKFEIGGPAGVAQALGPKVTAFFDEILTKLISHTHIGNLGAPTPLNPADLVAFSNLKIRAVAPESSNEMLSKWATVKDTPP
jgi:hypothetical protein